MENEITVYCKYCGNKISAKSRKRKFCNNNHKGAYSVANKQYWVINERFFIADLIASGNIAPKDVLSKMAEAKEAFEVMSYVADKEIKIENRVILFFSKEKYPEGIYRKLK